LFILYLFTIFKARYFVISNVIEVFFYLFADLFTIDQLIYTFNYFLLYDFSNILLNG